MLYMVGNRYNVFILDNIFLTYRIARSEKDGQNYIRGIKDPGMFMNCTASKAQYKPKPGSSASAKPSMYLSIIFMSDTRAVVFHNSYATGTE